MPEHIRALFVVLFLSAIVFYIAERAASEIIPRSEFVRRRNLWLVITISAFLAHNIWVYFAISGSLLLFVRARESNPPALFFLLLFVIPAFGVQVPGLGIVNYLFTLTHQRLLALVLLLPAFLTLIGQKQTIQFGRTTPDKLLTAYLIIIVFLYLRETSLTDTLRQGFNQFIDVFLPYYVISRSLKDVQSFRIALLSFVTAVLLLALMAAFEAARHWLLYAQLEQVLGIPRKFTSYLERAGVLRAKVTVGNIPLGYVIAIGIGFYLYLQQFIHSRVSRRMGLLLMIIGLVASVSRGPWVGAIFLFAVFILTGRSAVRNSGKFIITGVLALTLAFVLPGGEKFIKLLPYFGDSVQGTIDYRERLLENSIKVINRNPLFGSTDYLKTPEMEAMRQGQGIIDIVNTYIQVALESGYIGLTLFVSFFIVICWGVFRRFRRLPDKNSEECLLGRSLLAALAGILLIIFTVSSVTVVPVVYWSVAGLGAAYINMMDRMRRDQYLGNKDNA